MFGLGRGSRGVCVRIKVPPSYREQPEQSRMRLGCVIGRAARNDSPASVCRHTPWPPWSHGPNGPERSSARPRRVQTPTRFGSTKNRGRAPWTRKKQPRGSNALQKMRHATPRRMPRSQARRPHRRHRAQPKEAALAESSPDDPSSPFKRNARRACVFAARPPPPNHASCHTPQH